MNKTERGFRYLWRVNAVLILVATASISVLAGSLFVSELGWSSDRRRVLDASPPVVSPDSDERLYLGSVEQVEGTGTLRGELLSPGHGKGFSSGGYGSETRNMLFLDGHFQAARWLLPDSHHVVSRHIDINSGGEASNPKRLVATIVLVKAVSADADADAGALLIFDPTGKNVRTVAEAVRDVNHASLSSDGRITVLYERNRKYVIASFDAASLEKKTENELSVPQLN
jgi:prepilin-type processing-associated H-X9-DG protein